METEKRVEQLEKRLARAERRNWILLAVVLLAAGLMAVGAAKKPADVVDEYKAKAFVVVDANGTKRAELAMHKEAAPALRLYDGNSKNRIFLGASEDGPVFSLSDENGKTRANLDVSERGRPRFRLWDANGMERASLDVTEGGRPRFRLWDENHQARVWLYVAKHATRFYLHGEGGGGQATFDVSKRAPGFHLYDANGAGASLEVHKPGPRFSLRDESHKTHARLSAYKGSPLLYLRDENHGARLHVSKDGPRFGLSHGRKERASLDVSEHATRFYLYDPNGKEIIWKAP